VWFGPSCTRSGLKDTGPPPGLPPTRPGTLDLPPPQPTWDRSPNAKPPSNDPLRAQAPDAPFASAFHLPACQRKSGCPADTHVQRGLRAKHRSWPLPQTHGTLRKGAPGTLPHGGWLVSANKCDKNKREVCTRSDEVHVPLDNEDLDLGMVINVTQRWGYEQAAIVVLLR
jgi:hypothetical protein